MIMKTMCVISFLSFLIAGLAMADGESDLNSIVQNAHITYQGQFSQPVYVPQAPAQPQPVYVPAQTYGGFNQAPRRY